MLMSTSKANTEYEIHVYTYIHKTVYFRNHYLHKVLKWQFIRSEESNEVSEWSEWKGRKYRQKIIIASG
jgi:hypothetical protein